MASTNEGKAVSARNATTHGLFCRQTVLPHLGESPDAYEGLLEALFIELPPRNLMDRQYIELWAEASWKLRRLGRWEAQLWENDALDEDALFTKMERITRLQATLRRQLDKAVRMLQYEVPALYAERLRREVLMDLSMTEHDCRRDKHCAGIASKLVHGEQESRFEEAQDRLAALDRAALDNAAPDDSAQNCQNEPEPETRENNPDDGENCQNELFIVQTTPARTGRDSEGPCPRFPVKTFTFRQPPHKETTAAIKQFARACAGRE